MVLNTTTATKHFYEQQKKRQSIDNSMIRFPKLDECAHFHYEFAELVSVWHELFLVLLYCTLLCLTCFINLTFVFLIFFGGHF